VNVSTGAFEAITDRLDQLAAKVEHLEQREQARQDMAAIMAGDGRERGRRKARHLQAVRGEQ
jgi:hypothetical protein